MGGLFVKPAQIVAALAARLDAGPDALVTAWAELRGWEGLPEELWRVDDPGTAPLETLGASLPDKAAAKAARKALLKHRSCGKKHLRVSVCQRVRRTPPRAHA